jgi:mono/diheme cytochrome c family protein
VGPDGAVWIADFHNFIIQHNPTPSEERGGFKATTGVGGAHENSLRDHLRGRIYRVIAKDAPPEHKSLAKASTSDLVAALNDDVQYWRLFAQQKIVAGQTDATEALVSLVKANDGKTGAIHALWALSGLGTLDASTHRAALLAKDARLRRNAIRALGTDATAQSLFFGTGVVSDPDPANRLEACVKLASFPTTPEIQTLVKQLATDKKMQDDEWLKEASRLLSKRHHVELYNDGPNLLVNGDLEKLGPDGFPEGWTRRDYGQREANTSAKWSVDSSPKAAHGGAKAMHCVTSDEADTSFYQEVPIKPNTTYRLSGWIRTKFIKGKASYNDHIGRAETTKITSRDTGWVQVEAVFVNKDKPKASVNILHVAKGEAWYDDVKLCEVIPVEDPSAKVLAGDPKHGEEIFWKHPVAACMNCHMLGGKGSTVGPALDGIAARKSEEYITESLLEPNAKLAEGYVATPISPMPPMALLLKPQEIADVKAFLLKLK